MSESRIESKAPTNCIIAAFHNNFDVAILKRKFNVIPISTTDLLAVTQGEKPLFTPEQFMLGKTNVLQLQYPELKESGEEATKNLLTLLALSKQALEKLQLPDGIQFYSAFDFNLGFTGIDKSVIDQALIDKIQALGFKVVRTSNDSTAGKPALRLILVGAGKEGILAETTKKTYNFCTDPEGLKPMLGTAALVPALIIKTPPSSLRKLAGSPVLASRRMSPALLHRALGITDTPLSSSRTVTDSPILCSRRVTIHFEPMDVESKDTPAAATSSPDSTHEPDPKMKRLTSSPKGASVLLFPQSPKTKNGSPAASLELTTHTHIHLHKLGRGRADSDSN